LPFEIKAACESNLLYAKLTSLFSDTKNFLGIEWNLKPGSLRARNKFPSTEVNWASKDITVCNKGVEILIFS
jgi:hypothetical protein